MDYKIMIVEDDPDIAELLSSICRNLDFPFTCAGTFPMCWRNLWKMFPI